jgi:hypothetical protein
MYATASAAEYSTGAGNNLEQRRAGAVEIDAGRGVKCIMHRLAGVFFQVRALDLDIDRAAVFQAYGQAPVADDRQFVLADLIALRQVGVKVVFARKYTLPGDAAADREAEADRLAQRSDVRHRQRAGQCDIDHAGMRVRLGTVCGRRPGKQLARGVELGVDFQADDRLPCDGWGLRAGR